MEIVVPKDKPPLPHPHGRFVSRVRSLGILVYIGFVLLLSMVLAEGMVRVAFLRMTLLLVGAGLAGLLLTWIRVRLGAALLVLAMGWALTLVPREFLEWRPWFYGAEAVAALLGLMLLFAPREAARKHADTSA